MWKRILLAMTGHVAASSAPWYRRPDVWLLLGVIVLPFGWVIAVGHIAWAKIAARRERQRASEAFVSPLGRPEGNQGA